MINPDWTYNYLSGAQSAANLQASIPEDDRDTVISMASLDTDRNVEEEFIIPSSVYTSTARCFSSNVLDGLLIGAGLAGVFSMFPLLVRGRIQQSLKAPFNKGNIKIALFFGVLMGVYNTGRYHVRTTCKGNKSGQRALRALMAISIGYSASLLSHRVRKFMALFLLSRAIETKSKDIHRKLSPETQAAIAPLTNHADVILTTASMAINACGWIMAPDLLDKSYLTFLDSTSGYTISQLRRTPDMFCVGGDSSVRHCSVLHPHAPHGCTVELGKFAVRQYFTKSIRFYYKLYLIPLLLTTFRKRKLSLTAIRYFFQRTAQSALFFTSGGVAISSMFCLFSKLGLSASPALPAFAGMASGALVCIEPKSRRIELGLYLLTQSIHVIATYIATRTNLWYPPGADLLAISLGLYHLSAAYEYTTKNAHTPDRQLVRPFYVTTMKKIFDHEEPIDDQTNVCQDRLHAWSVTKYL
jgi:hypothetical protein